MQEKIMEELDRLMDKLNQEDPTGEIYGLVLDRYNKLIKALHDDSSSCEAELNGKIERELKRVEQELEKRKQDLSEKESDNRMKMAKIEAAIGLAKTILTILGTLAGILLVGSLETTTILSSKCLALVKVLFPKVF